MAQTTHAPLLAQLEAIQRLPALSVVALRVAVVLATWSRNHRTRKHLRDLDTHILRDIGIDRYNARVESQRRFWQ